MPIDNSSRFPKPLAADLLELSEGMAIVIDGDTAPKAITAGQYLFIKNHSTLATGGYHATAAIASGADITSSNTIADPNGIVNALRGTVDALNEAVSAANGVLAQINNKLNSVSIYSGTPNSTNVSALEGFVAKTHNTVSGYLIFTSKVTTSSNVTLITGLPGSYNGYVQLPCIPLSGSDQYRSSRVRITMQGEITMWYGLGLASGVPYLIPINYVCS